MSDLDQYIESGVLEMFVMGVLSPEEAREVAVMALKYPEVQEEIKAIEDAQEEMARLAALQPPSSVKDRLFSTLDDTDKETARAAQPPILNSSSTAEDFAQWLNDPAMVAPDDFPDIYVLPIAEDENGGTAILWLRHDVPPETHVDEIEKFLVLEGTCIIEIEGEEHELGPGDYLSIPLFHAHSVKITSDYPCKLILQRIAA